MVGTLDAQTVLKVGLDPVKNKKGAGATVVAVKMGPVNFTHVVESLDKTAIAGEVLDLAKKALSDWANEAVTEANP